MMSKCIAKGRDKMNHVKVSESAAGHMRRTGFSECMCHTCHFHRTNHATKIIVIRLNNLKPIIGNKPAKTMQVVFLFATCNWNGQCISNLFGFFIPVEKNRFFKKTITVRFQ